MRRLLGLSLICVVMVGVFALAVPATSAAPPLGEPANKKRGCLPTEPLKAVICGPCETAKVLCRNVVCVPSGRCRHSGGGEPW